MDANKGIKILRIVSLTLGILSMLFFLYTKIAHAETIQEPFPTDIPYMPDWKYSPFKDNTTAQNNLINAVNQYFIDSGFGQVPEYMLGFNSVTNNIYSVQIWYNGGKNNGKYAYGTYMMNEWLNGSSSYCQYIATQATIFVTTNGEYYSGSASPSNKNRNYTTYWQNRSSTALKVGEINDNYVIVYSNSQLEDVSYSNNNYDTYSGYITIEEVTNGNGELTEGEVTETLEKAQIVIDGGVQATDTIGNAKVSTIQGFFQGIANAIWNNGQNLIANFKSFFQPFFSYWSSLWSSIKDKIDEIKGDFESLLEKITAIVQILQQYVANDFTAGGIAQVWESNFTNSHINTLLTTGNNIKTALLELGDVEPNEPVITVNIQNNTFFGTTEEYQFNFTWYNNIKTPVLAFITAFWLVGLGIHLFTQIPNMIHGVSGTAHGIQNAMPTETYSHKDIYH